MRLIDVDELTKNLGIADMDCKKCKWGTAIGRGLRGCSRCLISPSACVAIENAPTIDAVEVVRCKDCIHAFGSMTKDGLYGGLVCDYMDNHVGDNFFCAWGERTE